MLLRFAVANHLSFRDRQELLFSVSSLKDNSDGLIHRKAVGTDSVLPAAVIFGANASGKSNFVDAIATMKEFVLRSNTHDVPGGRISHKPFKLDANYSQLRSKFEIDFIVEGLRYHYGFKADSKCILEEWLYAFPISRRRMMFERDISKFRFGRELKGKNKTIAESTTPNSLFVSTAAQSHHQQLSEVYRFFESIELSRTIPASGVDVPDRFIGDTIDSRVIDFLESIESGVTDYRVVKTKESKKALELSQGIDADSNQCSPSQRTYPSEINKNSAIELAHLDNTGEKVFFELDEEGAGTRRLLMVLSSVFHALDEGTLLCVDEIESSLHTHAAEAIVRLFCTPEINPKGAQLIATTHDTNLLGSSALRRDQIWFTEKSLEGATELYSLSDYRTHKGDDFELGYLQGRFGASPSGDIVSQFYAEP